MTNTCSHSIKVNLADGDVVNYSILVIKGRVSQLCLGEEYLEVHLNDSVSDELKTRLSSSGEFKILLDLREYETVIIESVELSLRLKYCSRAIRLQFFYKPSVTIYKVQPLYIVCRDEESVNAEKACNIINLNLRLVQCVYADKLQETGFGRRTFTLNGACRKFQSQLTLKEARESGEFELWYYFAEEILNSNWGSNSLLKFVAFIGCTKYEGSAVAATGDYSYENIRKHLRAHAALGGGGLALFGTGYFYAWPEQFNEIISCFRNEAKIDLKAVPDDSNYRRTYGGVFSSTLGAICHELGHAFDLGHTSYGIMGTGFDYINRVFTLDNVTENLPQRVLKNNSVERQPDPDLPRFTILKKPVNLLHEYHEKKQNDYFYFPHNCIVILAHHKWLREISDDADEEATITFDSDQNTVVSTHPIKMLEIRSEENSFVKWFFEFQNYKGSVLKFKIPYRFEKTNYLFVLTMSGQTTRLALNKKNINIVSEI